MIIKVNSFYFVLCFALKIHKKKKYYSYKENIRTIVLLIGAKSAFLSSDASCIFRVNKC